MNLKTRIEKLENRAVGGGNCRCLPEFTIITDSSQKVESSEICGDCGLKREIIEATFQIGVRINEH